MNQFTVIHPDAKIGNNVCIGAFSVIENDVIIGENSWIASNVTIFAGSRIGKNCRIFPGAVIGAIPQDLKFKGEYTTLEIGDNTTIRECCTLNRGTAAKGKTIVGNNCLLMAYSHVAHDCKVGNNVIIGNASQLAGEVEIEDYAILSGVVAVHQFVRIGAHTMISGGSLVRKDVPPYTKAAHEPLSYVGINSIGLRRRQFDGKTISDIQQIYRILFVSKLNTKNAVAEIIEKVSESEHKTQILEFVRNSKRGIMKGYVKEEED